MTTDLTLTLPSQLPAVDKAVLCCDRDGLLQWETWETPTTIQIPDTSTSVSEKFRLGADITKDVPFGPNSAYLSLTNATYRNRKPLSEMDENAHWSAVYLEQPYLDMGNSTVESNTFTASTLYVEDAPKSKMTDRLFAVNIKSGRSIFREKHNAVSPSDAAVIVEGGLGVGKSIRCDETLFVNNIQVSEGSTIGKTLFGKMVVGASDVETVSAIIEFDSPMPNVDYVITGNVVSTAEDDAVYTCSFKGLTARGCRVLVHRLDSNGLSDITTAVHYYVVGTTH